MYIDIHVQCMSFLSDFKQNWTPPTNFSVIPHKKFHEICPVGVTLIYADGKTDLLKFVTCKRAY